MSARSSEAHSKGASTIKPGSNWKALKKSMSGSNSASSDPSSSSAPPKKKVKTTHDSEHHQTASSTAMPPAAPALSKRAEKSQARRAWLQQEEERQNSRASSVAESTGSPAPTTLPWFADDLSPDDLALVRHIQGGGDATLSLPGAKNSAADALVNMAKKDAQSMARLGKGESSTAAAALMAANSKEAALKKRVILGGWDENVSEEKKAPGSYIAIDCEMVGVGPRGSESVLARVSIVNWHGYTLMDSFVKPREKVTDYRTWVSGIRPKDLVKAPAFSEVQTKVAELIKGKTIVGHAIHNDLKALLLTHPSYLIRDTSTFQPLRDLAKTTRPSLRTLVKLTLGIEIQKDGEEHSSVEDARATMAVFRTQKVVWDTMLRKGGALHNSSKGGGVVEGEEGARGTIRKAGDNSAGPRAKAPHNTGRVKTASEPGWWKAPA